MGTIRADVPVPRRMTPPQDPSAGEGPVRTALRPLRVAKAYAQGDDLRRLRIRRDELRKLIRRTTPIVVREGGSDGK